MERVPRFPITVKRTAAGAVNREGEGKALRPWNRSAEVCVDEIPVDQLADDRGQVIGPAVLVIEIVGVLPDVKGEERFLAVNDGGVGVCGLDDLQRSSLEDKPRPAASELGHSGVLQLLREFFDNSPRRR